MIFLTLPGAIVLLAIIGIFQFSSGFSGNFGNYAAIFCLAVSLILFIELYIVNKTGRIYRSKTTTAWLLSFSSGDRSWYTPYDRVHNPTGFKTFFRLHVIVAVLYALLGYFILF